MGDRVWASVTIHKDDLNYILQSRQISKDAFLDQISAEEVTEDGDTCTFNDSQCNYGDWDSVEKILQKEEMEYDKHWEAGGDFGAGDAYYRKVNGQYRSMEIYDVSYDLINFLDEAKNITDFVDLKKLIEDKLSSLVPFEETPLQPKAVSKWGRGEKEIKL